MEYRKTFQNRTQVALCSNYSNGVQENFSKLYTFYSRLLQAYSKCRME